MSVTQVIHNGAHKVQATELFLTINSGWRVDFNVSLSSFEPLIAGSRNLIDLALSTPLPGGPAILFVSSAGILRSRPFSVHYDQRRSMMAIDYSASDPASEDPNIPPEYAAGSGYPESKWVAEQLFRRAAVQTGLRTTSARVCQVSGDQRTGGWNTSEWVPTLVRTSQRLGCLPSRADVRNTCSDSMI